MLSFFILCGIFVCHGRLPVEDWDLAATGSFMLNDESVGMRVGRLDIITQWPNGDFPKLFLDAEAELDSNLNLLSRDGSYIMFFKLDSGLPRIVYATPMTICNMEETRSILEKLGEPKLGFTPARHGFQSHWLDTGWYWHPNFGLYKDYENDDSIAYHDQLQWIYKITDNPRVDWDIWLWHYHSSGWIWTHLAVYPWFYSVNNGWMYLLEDGDINAMWFFILANNEWTRIQP